MDMLESFARNQEIKSEDYDFSTIKTIKHPDHPHC